MNITTLSRLKADTCSLAEEPSRQQRSKSGRDRPSATWIGPRVEPSDLGVSESDR